MIRGKVSDQNNQVCEFVCGGDVRGCLQQQDLHLNRSADDDAVNFLCDAKRRSITTERVVGAFSRTTSSFRQVM